MALEKKKLMQKLSFLLAGIIFSLFILTFSSCSKKNKTADIIKQLEESLVNSSKVINLSTETTMKALQEKTIDYCTKERAKIWYSKAEFISKETKKLFDHIETLKSNGKIEDRDRFNLFLTATKYKENTFAIDPEIKKVFEKDFQFVNNSISMLGGDTTSGNNPITKEIPNSSIRPLLISLQNDIKIVENKTVYFCNIKVGCNIFIFDSYSAIVGQNSNYLKPGSELEINAGVGAFSKSAQPTININGIKVELSEEGFSTYKMKVPKKAGIYSVAVEIKFTNQTTGNKEQKKINVEYTVAKPCDQ